MVPVNDVDHEESYLIPWMECRKSGPMADMMTKETRSRKKRTRGTFVVSVGNQDNYSQQSSLCSLRTSKKSMITILYRLSHEVLGHQIVLLPLHHV